MSFENITLPNQTTVDATPLVVPVRNINPGEAVRMVFTLVAKTAAGEVSAWKATRTVQRIGSAAPSVVGTAPVAERENTVGAAAWAATVGASGNAVAVTLTGAVATSITWALQAFVVSCP